MAKRIKMGTPDDWAGVVAAIEAKRAETGGTMTEAAESVGMAQSHWSRAVAGREVKLATLQKMASAVGYRVEIALVAAE